MRRSRTCLHFIRMRRPYSHTYTHRCSDTHNTHYSLKRAVTTQHVPAHQAHRSVSHGVPHSHLTQKHNRPKRRQDSTDSDHQTRNTGSNHTSKEAAQTSHRPHTHASHNTGSNHTSKEAAQTSHRPRTHASHKHCESGYSIVFNDVEHCSTSLHTSDKQARA